jgi:ubiquinone/menaquinone biosynthesis C-methylase UbiE
MSDSRVRQYYERNAATYDAAMGTFERLLLKDARAWAASKAYGDALEIGVGTGRNLPFYSPDIRLVGVDVSPAMLAIARRRAADVGLRVDFREADAQALPFAADAFDSVVCTLALCSIPDDRQSIAEMRRVLKPGGQLVLVEHVRSPIWAVRAVQHVLEPLMLRLEQDHLLRDPLDHLEASGLAVESCQRNAWGLIERTLATKPA